MEGLLPILKALADGNRLRIIGLLAQEERSVEELAALLGVRSPTVSHHLSRLAENGLVHARAHGYYNLYRLNPAPLRSLAERLLKAETLSELASDVDRSRYQKMLFADLASPDGRLRALPAQGMKRAQMIEYLMHEFEPGKRYREKEVDEILSRLHVDPENLRLALVERGRLAHQDGLYRRRDSLPMEN
jgi:DNA-binding transcriptional ArsR family regulator